MTLLLKRYAESHRHYHTVEHIRHCLEEAENCRSIQDHPFEIDLALWFHDAIYRPFGSANVLKSARLATSKLQQAGLPDDSIELISTLIKATMHPTDPEDPDARIVSDIDLSILGSDPKTYDRYEINIRREFEPLPEILYLHRRINFLEQLLELESIYHTEYFIRRYEEAAQENLKRTINRFS